MVVLKVVQEESVDEKENVRDGDLLKINQEIQSGSAVIRIEDEVDEVEGAEESDELVLKEQKVVL